MAKRKTRRRFSDEFKAEAVKLVKQSNRSMADLAMELGINAKSIGEWVKRAEESGQAIDEDERAELRRLRKEVNELRMEREILKKATASSIGQRNTFSERLCRRNEVQGLAGALIQAKRDLVQVSLREGRQVGLLRKVLSK